MTANPPLAAPTFQAGAPVFLLIDPLCGDVGPMAAVVCEGIGSVELVTLRERHWQRSVYPCPAPAKAPLATHEHPYLVALLDDDPWLQWAMGHSEHERQASLADDALGMAPHALGGLLQSAAAPESVSASLSALLQLRAPGQGAASYLRLADRRTLSWAVQIAGPARIAQALPRVEAWYYLDVDGAWAWLPVQDSPRPVPLTWTASEWRRMQQGAWIHAAVARRLARDPKSAKVAGPDLRAAAEVAWQGLQPVFKARPAAFAHDLDRHVAMDLQCSHPSLLSVDWLAAIDHHVLPSQSVLAQCQSALAAHFEALKKPGP